MHSHFQAKVSDAHGHLVESVNEGSERLSLLLVDAYQGDRDLVMRPACSKLSLKLHHECGEAVNGIGWELGKPAEGCSLKRCRENSA